MIDTKELAIKLSNILNGLDSETNSIENPMSEYIFDVKTYGEHLDSFFDKTKKQNVIPVFIADTTGDIQPIKNVENISYGFEIIIYFPISLKSKILDLKAFLEKCFVGQIRNYGAISGNAVSNISIPKIADFQRLQMKGLQEFIKDEYALPIDETQLWANLQFNLFLSTYKSLNDDNTTTEILLGNELEIELTYNNIVEKGYFVGAGTTMNGDIISQQLITADRTTGLVRNTSYGDTYQIYVRKNAFWTYLLQQYFTHNFSAKDLTIKLSLSSVGSLSTYVVACQSISFNFQWGQPVIAIISITEKTII